MRKWPVFAVLTLITSACTSTTADVREFTAQDGVRFQVSAVTEFDQPWAMTFLPDGRLLVTEKPGRLLVVTQDGEKSQPIENVPEVDYGGQGGLGDVVLHPDYATNGIVYLSYAEAGDGGVRGAAVARARLELTATGGRLNHPEVIWRQQPKVSGRGHYGHRLAFAGDGKLFITSGERQKFDPAQDMQQNLGKIVRLNDDGTIPPDNPFADRGGIAAQIWTLGHRNPLGLAFDGDGQLWNHEMGPRGGDELNRVVRGDNYGYPIVSNGRHYDGRSIPDHSTRPEFHAPQAYWVPSISPAGFIIYSGELFPDWQGDGFIGGLSSQSLVRIEFSAGADGKQAAEAERFDMGRRIREIEQGPDGAIWLLEDQSGGRLLKLTPAT
jgi:glucose/arabinose dehydrogenase